MKRIILFICLVSLLIACGRSITDTETVPAFEEILKIDIHTHVFKEIPGLPDMMRKNNIRMINICTVGNNPDLLVMSETIAEHLFDKYGSLFSFASTFDLTKQYESDYVQQVRKWLDTSYRNGAVMTKIWKEIGMEIKNQAGEFIMPDDPLFNPIFEHIIQSGKPVLCHLAEPIGAWLPLNPDGIHYGYYSQHPEWHFYGKEGMPAWEQIIEARDNLLARHPDLTFIGAHLGSMSHDVDLIAQRLDRYPNFYVDCAARTKQLTWQPSEKVRKFFMTYQDRVVYGTDIIRRPDMQSSTQSDIEYKEDVEDIEEQYRLDYQYYAGSGTMVYYKKETECLALPRDVLEKFYFRNAQRIIPELVQ